MQYKIGPGETVAGAVVTAVSTAENSPPDSLPLLHDVVDTDALNNLFASIDDGPTRQTGTVSFEYSESLITVYNTDQVTVEPLAACP